MMFCVDLFTQQTISRDQCEINKKEEKLLAHLQHGRKIIGA